MLLAVDIGNTNISLGLFEGASLRAEVRIGTRRASTRDEVAVALSQHLALLGFGFDSIDAAIVASVVPPALGPYLNALEEYAGVKAIVVGPGVKTGMKVRYDPPQDVGADRIVTAVSAFARYGAESEGRGVVVVDFGTATTFDVVTPGGEYMGGVIAPGLGISADALFARAAKLPRVEINKPAAVVGRNTVHAIQSGMVYGYVGLVEGVIRRIRAELDWPVKVVATGGFSTVLGAETDCVDAIDNALMLEGLRLIYERNQG